MFTLATNKINIIKFVKASISTTAVLVKALRLFVRSILQAISPMKRGISENKA
jgi:hypothetical protein